jgi:hypothetical protein
MIKKIILLIILTAISLPTSIYANEEVGKLAENWFTTFSEKISKKYTTEKEILYFEAFSDKLDYLLITRSFNAAQIKLVNDLIKLSNEYVFKQKIEIKEKENKNIIKNNKLINSFKYKSYNTDNIFIEN